MGARPERFGVDARERFVPGFAADGEDDGWFGRGEAPVLRGTVVDFEDAWVAGGLPDGEAELCGEEREEGEGPRGGTRGSGGSCRIHGDYGDLESGWVCDLFVCLFRSLIASLGGRYGETSVGGV